MNKELRVDRTLDVNEFVAVVGGKAGGFSKPATGICLDTRVLKLGDLFFAIQSSRDGHEFVQAAVDKGAVACVVSRDLGLKNQILVKDTQQALWDYAGWIRNQWGKSVVALSGSNGKTSTKEMIAILLGDQTLKTPGTWNNFLGVPLTLFLLQHAHDYAVIEMGINHFGELTQLCKFTKPNVAALTNIGPAHLMEFKNLEGVAKAKGEIFAQLQSTDIAVLNMDDPYIEKMRPSIRAKTMTISQKESANIQLMDKIKKDKGYDLTIRYGKTEIKTYLPLNGQHNVSNYLCALAVASALGISSDKIIKRTAKIQQVHMRMEETKLADNRTIINDCYNANLGSFRAALQTVNESNPKRLLVLMGDILEMGAQAVDVHKDLGRLMAESNLTHLFVMGEYAHDAKNGAMERGMSANQITVIENKSQAHEKILPYFNAGDILLVKGSRGMKLEEVIASLEQHLKG